jgi:hypothetical protein
MTGSTGPNKRVQRTAVIRRRATAASLGVLAVTLAVVAATTTLPAAPSTGAAAPSSAPVVSATGAPRQTAAAAAATARRIRTRQS